MYCMIGGFVTNIFFRLSLCLGFTAWNGGSGLGLCGRTGRHHAGGLLCMRGQKIPVGIPRQALSVFSAFGGSGWLPLELPCAR